MKHGKVILTLIFMMGLGLLSSKAPMQAFWVRANASAELGLNNDLRLHSDQAWLKQRESIPGVLRLTVSSDASPWRDELMLEFDHPSGQGGAEKMFSMYREAPSLYSLTGETPYSISFHGQATQHTIMPLGFRPGADGLFAITAVGADHFEQIYLVDRQLGYYHNLQQANSYQFTAGTGDDPLRFKLRFGSADPTAIHEPSEASNVWCYENTLYVKTDSEDLRLTLLDISGRHLRSFWPGRGEHSYPLDLPPGVYVAAGTYTSGTIFLANGVSVFGGFHPDTWEHNENHQVIISHNGIIDGGRIIGIQSVDITSNTIRDLLTIQTPDADSHGVSNYGIHIANSSGLHLQNNNVNAGAGSAGEQGINGSDGADGNNGHDGAPGDCDSDVNATGGSGGSSPIGRSGGQGGAGRYGNNPGYNGTPGQVVGSGGGSGGQGGAANICDGGDNGSSGQPGNSGISGSNGNGGSGGSIVSDYWLSASGEPGTSGSNGHGGGGAGGGGASGGSAYGIFSFNTSGAANYESQNTFSGGNAGQAGNGGLSYGESGQNGQVGEVVFCAYN